MRSIKYECLARVIPFGEHHLRRTIAEFIAHYHRERNHQGLGNELIDGVSQPGGTGGVRRRQRVVSHSSVDAADAVCLLVGVADQAAPRTFLGIPSAR